MSCFAGHGKFWRAWGWASALWLLSLGLQAQLSPGDLAKAHAHLEGTANCTKCHEIGKQVSDAKCLDCHKEVQALVRQNRGYHASREVKGKACAACHSDHHGRNFNMVRFDEKTFDHKLTGYELSGAHKKADCRDCHKPDLVRNPDLKKRSGTWLGMGRECAECHADVHQKTLGNQCTRCHTTDAFAPASKFEHGKTHFALQGKHKTVACIECHKKETRNGAEFQRFAGVEFSNCTSCHSDAHQNKLGNACKECHSEQSWQLFLGMNRYNHNRTRFPLKGKHRQVDCAACHEMKVATAATVFQDRLGISTDQCVACHKDVHENQFGQNCKDCHTENSFRTAGTSAAFNHGLTDFPLRGKHASVDCKACHKQNMTDPLPHDRCSDCHADFHEGQFLRQGVQPDCAACHSEEGFAGSLFTLEQHANTRFPLTGAHLATPCLACHKKTEKWRFREIGNRCVDCHQDVHRGFIEEKYYPGQACETCHQTEAWTTINFLHESTGFALEGAHSRKACMDCHGNKQKAANISRYSDFSLLSQDCISCHNDVHYTQFQKDGKTDCTRCHSFEAWLIEAFPHDKTAFPLEGKHAEIACSDCHKEVVRDQQTFVQYKIERFACADCHK